ncbi:MULTISPECIES: UvrD-helicase domain-containing protein [unclassified Microcoleus]|uniref:UvrD-helicase domain-containing protein n=1 Tax=unclassified Microcoleus TaxID=2642155 RepID=UPI002FD56F98
MEQWINFEQSFNQRLNSQHLDEQQTKARNFSLKGHALVRGVAGSGKSLLLRNRIERLIDEGYNDILVLCYNRFMKGWIDSIIAQKGLSSKVECRTFHSWAYRIGYTYKWDEIPEKREQIIDLVKTYYNANPKKRYQAILIDEAQDFYDEWFMAMLSAVDPDTNSIFFVYDNTQSVYGEQHLRKPGWTWKDIGFNVPGGRSQILDLNYRNAPQIIELAWQFIIPYLASADMKIAKRSETYGKIRHIVEPLKKSSRSSSINPMLVKSDMSPDNIAKQVKLALSSHPESSIGVLLHPQESKDFKLEISKFLWQLDVPNHAPMRSQERDHNVVNRPFVIVDSWNALKGVEFDAVIIAGVDKVEDLPDPDKDFSEKAGLYIAITRARDHVVMLYQNETKLVQQLQNILTAPDVLESDSIVSDKAA